MNDELNNKEKLGIFGATMMLFHGISGAALTIIQNPFGGSLDTCWKEITISTIAILAVIHRNRKGPNDTVG